MTSDTSQSPNMSDPQTSPKATERQTRSGRIYNPYVTTFPPKLAPARSSRPVSKPGLPIHPHPSRIRDDQLPQCCERIWHPGEHSEDMQPCAETNAHQIPHYVCRGCRDNIRRKLHRFELKTQRMTQLELCSRCTQRSLRDYARLKLPLLDCQCRGSISKRWRCFDCRLDADKKLTDAHNAFVCTLISPHGCMMCPCGLAMPDAVQMVTICSQCRYLTLSEGQ